MFELFKFGKEEKPVCVGQEFADEALRAYEETLKSLENNSSDS